MSNDLVKYMHITSRKFIDVRANPVYDNLDKSSKHPFLTFVVEKAESMLNRGYFVIMQDQ